MGASFHKHTTTGAHMHTQYLHNEGKICVDTSANFKSHTHTYTYTHLFSMQLLVDGIQLAERDTSPEHAPHHGCGLPRRSILHIQLLQMMANILCRSGNIGAKSV